jgi:mannose-6-phosphate isomerase-like protein (cupin superfamily)
MEYLNFTTNDYIEDARFRQWVRKPNAELDAFWQDFLEKHPEKTPKIIAATNFLLGIEQQVEGGTPAAAHEEVVFQRIKQIIAEAQRVPLWRRLPRWTSWATAASVLFVVGYWLLPLENPQNQEASYKTNREQTTLALIEKINATAEPLSIALTDGSTVRLQPGSRISYARNFTESTNREVYLSGEAFFEVSKNPNKPFFVYANELVTKVLGTSFNVRAYPNDKDVTVEVRTGRVAVAVAKKVGDREEISTREREGILLLPNQQAVLARKEIRLVKTLVREPLLLSETAPNLPKYNFIFEDTPVPEVFNTMARAYGLDIVFNEEQFVNCYFTADLNDVPPYEKIDIVCRSIEARYRILDAQIIIDGKGCKH